MAKAVSINWSVILNGSSLDLTKRNCIKSIEIQEQCDGSDTCTLTVQDPNFLYIEDNLFVEEAKVEVNMGFHGETSPIHFSGYISAIDIDFPEEGYPILSIFCLDNSHVMNRQKNTRSWDNVTRAEVVQILARAYGFNCVVESGYAFTRESTISQSNTTDIEFCESLAGQETVPFMCKLIGNTLYYVKKGVTQSPTATLYYRKYPYDVISFSPRITKEALKDGMTFSNVDTSQKAVYSHTSTSNNTSRDVQGDSVKPSTDGQTYSPITGTWSSTS